MNWTSYYDSQSHSMLIVQLISCPTTAGEESKLCQPWNNSATLTETLKYDPLINKHTTLMGFSKFVVNVCVICLLIGLC